MAQRKTRDVWEYGDFQTPLTLAEDVCHILTTRGIAPRFVLEPTCGRGTFLQAASTAFPSAQLLGVDINPNHLAAARNQLQDDLESGRVNLIEGDFFQVAWEQQLQQSSDPWLILGNPPWVTSSELGLLSSTNLPTKSNFQKHRGFDAISGKSNFDISEWMLLKYLEWLRGRDGYIAVLVKTAVARKILMQAWMQDYPLASASIHRIDAAKHFGAAVDACLLVLHITPDAHSTVCEVFESLDAVQPSHSLGIRNGSLINDVTTYEKWHHLRGQDPHYVWRSGVKHDCSRVMELRTVNEHLENGAGEIVQLESRFLYPMLKSSDVHKGIEQRRRQFMIVTQSHTGEDTRSIEFIAPETWKYLQRHAETLGRRSSSIYRNRPPFSIFGVGDYTFAPWKVAISGFYKSLNFVPIGPSDGKATVLDDTVYFLPCTSESEALFLSTLLNSTPAREFYNSMIFWSNKRPITSEVLKRLDLEALSEQLGMKEKYERFTGSKSLDPASPIQLSF